jgi:hypothetical protein
MSHWNDQKSWPAVEIERYRTRSAIRHVRRKKAEHQDDRQRRAPNPRDAQRCVAGIEPQHRGRIPECARAQRLVHAPQVVGQRQDALRADQSAGLHPERDECDQVDPAQRFQEQSRGAVHETHSRM